MKSLSLFVVCFLITFSIKAQEVVERENMNTDVFSIPIGFGFGLGFDNQDIFETTEGDEVTLSGGGGLFVGTGLYYNTKKIRVGSTVNYQVSNLRPEIDNGKASFKRIVISPEIKFPINMNNGKSINIGGGMSFYLNGKLKIDASEIVGVKVASTYKNESGIHFLIDYEEEIPAGYLNMGLKYYNVNYEISGGDFFFPTLNGSGIDLYMSFAFKLK